MFMFTSCMQDPEETRRGFGCPRTGTTGCLPAFPCVQGTELQPSGGAASYLHTVKNLCHQGQGCWFPTTESRVPHSVPWCFQTHGCEGKIVSLQVLT